MFKVNQTFIDYVCGKNNRVKVDELTAAIIAEHGQTIYVKLNKEVPAIGKLDCTSEFGVCKSDFDKWFTKI
jgi:hypothetical protein